MHSSLAFAPGLAVDPEPAVSMSEPLTVTTLFASTKRALGRVVLPPHMELKAAFSELKLDLREAILPYDHVVLVCESLCASVVVVLPDGTTVDDRSATVMSSRKVGQSAASRGPIVHLEGWSVCSDVKVLTASEVDAPVTWS